MTVCSLQHSARNETKNVSGKQTRKCTNRIRTTVFKTLFRGSISSILWSQIIINSWLR